MKFVRVFILSIIVFNPLCGYALAEDPVVEEGFKKIIRGQFTTGVVDKEPIDRIIVFTNDQTKLYYFTDVRSMEGEKISHYWKYNGKVMSKFDINIDGPRWRTFSRVTLNPNMLGKWSVVVTSEDGWPLRETIFEYVKAENSTVSSQ